MRLNTTDVVLASLVAIVMLLGWNHARAQESELHVHLPSKHHLDTHEEGHPEYSKWRRPDNPGGSCCDAKIWHDGDGHQYFTGHCYEARNAMLVEGQWMVQFDTGQWFRVPPERILHNKEGTPNPGVAHICEHLDIVPKDPILCFREPVGGT